MNRQQQAERRTFPDLALQFDLPIVLVDDAPDDGQAKTGADLNSLGRKSWIKKPDSGSP